MEVEDVADLIASQGDGLPFFYSGEELVLDDSDDDAAEGSAGVGGGGGWGGRWGERLVLCVKMYHPEGTPAAPLSIPITTPQSPPASRYMRSILYHHHPLAAGDTPYPSDR